MKRDPIVVFKLQGLVQSQCGANIYCFSTFPASVEDAYSSVEKTNKYLKCIVTLGKPGMEFSKS